MKLNPCPNCGGCLSPQPNCFPVCPPCLIKNGSVILGPGGIIQYSSDDAHYALTGTVTDDMNGTTPMYYYPVVNQQMPFIGWISGPLPITISDVIDKVATAKSGGSCVLNSSDSPTYYQYYFSCAFPPYPGGGSTPAQFWPNAGVLIPLASCDGSNLNPDVGGSVFDSFSSTPTMPWFAGGNVGSYGFFYGLFNAVSTGTAFLPHTQEDSCDPLTYKATFLKNAYQRSPKKYLPFTTATFKIPRFTGDPSSYVCSPGGCPTPAKDLTLSWVNSGGNGSGVLKFVGRSTEGNGLGVWKMGQTSSATGDSVWASFDGQSLTITLSVNGSLVSITMSYSNYGGFDDPRSLIFTPIYTCDPFFVSWPSDRWGATPQLTVTITNAGYTKFTLTI